MQQELSLADRILQQLARTPGCMLDDLIQDYPDVTWNQILLEVDRLSRTGHVLLRAEGRGQYSVRLIHH